jgi:hypothetical protein
MANISSENLAIFELRPPIHFGRTISNKSPVLQYQFGTDMRPTG